MLGNQRLQGRAVLVGVLADFAEHVFLDGQVNLLHGSQIGGAEWRVNGRAAVLPVASAALTRG